MTTTGNSATNTDTGKTVAEQVERVLKPIQQFVRGWMMGPVVAERAKQLGLQSENDMWIIGRAGVLGDCPPDVAAAGLAFIGPAGVRAAWVAIPDGSSPMKIASEYAALCHAWGTTALARFDQLRMQRLDELGRRVINAADGSIGAVFAGWRAMPEPSDVGARAALTGHVLRELRGGAHIAALAACGITPLDAILASPAPAGRSGPPWAEHLHWTGPFRDANEVRAARARAEQLTSEILHPCYGVLSPADLDEFAELIETTRNAIDM
jgi:hypothetical protein